MKFPKKFKKLIEIELKDIDVPDYVWLTYAVCACENDSCGWGGWMIDSVYKKSNSNFATGTGDMLLPAFNQQICPSCGKEVFRTSASIRLEPSSQQEPVHGQPEIDYKVAPIEYE